ncbi:protein I'm not dead yet-like isoform X2 [Leptidea sinapis]|uniref:protein I'm not dead yet-like isoform X2 n=1 Tax=Leptidea sinapis TaxID=189913 RepID=UPI0021C374E4|nr:protein I'm not dead yet-like isoform X2 [Leptidea sinapis]
MGIIKSFLRKDPGTPIKGWVPRIKNLLIHHFRGIFGTLILIILIILFLTSESLFGKAMHPVTFMCLWMVVFWLLQPISVPATGFIPIFFLPATGILSSTQVCKCYFNENIAIFILSGMVLLLLNLSGMDKRIVLKLLCCGDVNKFTGISMVGKSAIAAFFLSMFCNRLLLTSVIVQYITPAYQNLQSYTSRYRATEPNYDEMRYIVLSCVQTSAAIGGTAILHSSYATLAMRAIFESINGSGSPYPDVFSFTQYFIFAFPLAFGIFILNTGYHMVLINRVTKKNMSISSKTEMMNSMLKYKSTIPKSATCHELLTIFSIFLYTLAMFGVSSQSTFLNIRSPQLPRLREATVAALFVLLLHVVPRSCGFPKLVKAKKRSELGVLKPESAILWWKYVDRNSAGVAIHTALFTKGLTIMNSVPGGLSPCSLLLIVGIIAVILANIMSGVAACCCLLPIILNLIVSSLVTPNIYRMALAVGIGSSFGFMFPFLYTPAYYVHYEGKVPIHKMVIYSIGSLIICILLLWLAVCYWAPILFSDTGVVQVTTLPPEEAAPPAGGG